MEIPTNWKVSLLFPFNFSDWCLMKLNNQTTLLSIEKTDNDAFSEFVDQHPYNYGAINSRESFLLSNKKSIPFLLIERECSGNKQTPFNITLNGNMERLDCSYPYEHFCVLCNEIWVLRALLDHSTCYLFIPGRSQNRKLLVFLIKAVYTPSLLNFQGYWDSKGIFHYVYGCE